MEPWAPHLLEARTPHTWGNALGCLQAAPANHPSSLSLASRLPSLGWCPSKAASKGLGVAMLPGGQGCTPLLPAQFTWGGTQRGQQCDGVWGPGDSEVCLLLGTQWSLHRESLPGAPEVRRCPRGPVGSRDGVGVGAAAGRPSQDPRGWHLHPCLWVRSCTLGPVGGHRSVGASGVGPRAGLLCRLTLMVTRV